MKKKQDETEYLMSTKANEKELDESIAQLEAGKGISVALEDLFSEDDKYYLPAMEKGRKSKLLSEKDKAIFLDSLKKNNLRSLIDREIARGNRF